MTQSKEISIVDWFQPNKLNHLEAFDHLMRESTWPEGFITENIEFPSLWTVQLETKMARQFIADRLHAREIAEHGADCKISIGRVTCSDQPDYIQVRIDDSTSRSLIFEGRMKLADYAKCITGLSYVGIIGEYICSYNVGRTSEHKTIDIEFPAGTSTSPNCKKVVRTIIAGYEVDGWSGCDNDAFNHHRSKGRPSSAARGFRVTVYEISFHRYV